MAPVDSGSPVYGNMRTCNSGGGSEVQEAEEVKVAFAADATSAGHSYPEQVLFLSYGTRRLITLKELFRVDGISPSA